MHDSRPQQCMNTLQTRAVSLNDLTLYMYGHGPLHQNELESVPTWSGSQYLLPRSIPSRELLPFHCVRHNDFSLPL